MNYPAASCEVSKYLPSLACPALRSKAGMGGDEGEGEMKHKITPALTLPHQWGGSYWK